MDDNKVKKFEGSLASSSLSFEFSSLSSSDTEDLEKMPLTPQKFKSAKRLSRQLSLASCETPRDLAWKNRRRQILIQEREKAFSVDLTDEDLYELKGSIELGFGFNEEEGQRLCNTLPALDLYFAVNRQLSPSSVSMPDRRESEMELDGRSWSFGSESDWKICSPGENPQEVKSRLRHWAQAVACAVMQSH